MASPAAPVNKEELTADALANVLALTKTISYYALLRSAAREEEAAQVTIPPAVFQIMELAKTLTPPDAKKWGAMAAGKAPVPAKKAAKKKEVAAEGGERRSRGSWTDETKAELVRLADDFKYREQVMVGKEAGQEGIPNWAALARHFGFSGTTPLHRMYTNLTGLEPPGVKTKAVKTEEDEKDGAAALPPPAKKAKTEAAAAPAPAVASAGGWTPELEAELVKLVEDGAYRKAVTRKTSLKWSRLSEALGMPKKMCKKKYRALTGKEVADE